MECQQIFYILIYCFKPVKLKTLNIYIIINLVNSYIKPSKYLANTFINWIQNTNKSFRLYDDYQSLNNEVI